MGLSFVDEYFVGVFTREESKYDKQNRTYEYSRIFDNKQDAWEYALKFNLKGYYIDIEYCEDDKNGELSYAPHEMKKYFNAIGESKTQVKKLKIKE